MLTWLTFVPCLGAIALAFLPKEAVKLQRLVTLGTTAVAAVLGAIVWFGFDGSSDAMQYAIRSPWFFLRGAQGPIQVNYGMGVDGISILLVALTAFLMPIVVLSTFGHIRDRVKEFCVWLLVMQTGMFGVFLATDLVLFYFFWEVSLVPLYFMLGIWGSSRRLYATIKFFLYTLAGSLLMLIAAIYLIYQHGTTDIAELTARLAGEPLDGQLWLFLGFAIAFAIKVPMLPFHTWLPDAHTEAPTAGSVILAGVLLKMGTYGLLRFGIAMFPQAAVACAPWFMALGAIGIVYGAFLALAQADLKRLIACSSVSHLGYVVLGLFALTQAGLRGSVIQMVNHGLSTGLLFLLVGMIYERRHTRMLDQYGGIAKVMPIFAVFLGLAVFSSVGLPGLNGFAGEYLILLGTFEASPLWASIGVTGVIFGAVYLLSATRRVLFGPVTNEANENLADVNGREMGTMLPLCVMCVWIGIQPATFTDRMAGSVGALVERLEDARELHSARALTSESAEGALALAAPAEISR